MGRRPDFDPDQAGSSGTCTEITFQSVELAIIALSQAPPVPGEPETSTRGAELMGYSKSMPDAPRAPDPGRPEALVRWERTQNIFRMWRDFPEQRFGQFLDNALRRAGITHSVGMNEVTRTEVRAANFFYVRDYQLECACFRFWVNRSGRTLGPHLEKRWAEWID